MWDRGTGQAAQVALAAGAVLVLPTAVRTPVLGLLVGALVLVVVAGFAVPRQAVRTFGAETRRVLGAGAWRTVLLLSVVAAGGHLLVFVVAARTAGVTAPMHELVPLGLLVLLGSAVPLGVAGWGPREGVAAWAFAAAGLGGATGLSVAVVYGVMSMVATLPGVLTLGIGLRWGAPRVAAPLDRAGARHG